MFSPALWTPKTNVNRCPQTFLRSKYPKISVNIFFFFNNCINNIKKICDTLFFGGVIDSECTQVPPLAPLLPSHPTTCTAAPPVELSSTLPSVLHTLPTVCAQAPRKHPPQNTLRHAHQPTCTHRRRRQVLSNYILGVLLVWPINGTNNACIHYVKLHCADKVSTQLGSPAGRSAKCVRSSLNRCHFIESSIHISQMKNVQPVT